MQPMSVPFLFMQAPPTNHHKNHLISPKKSIGRFGILRFQRCHGRMTTKSAHPAQPHKKKKTKEPCLDNFEHQQGQHANHHNHPQCSSRVVCILLRFPDLPFTFAPCQAQSMYYVQHHVHNVFTDPGQHVTLSWWKNSEPLVVIVDDFHSVAQQNIAATYRIQYYNRWFFGMFWRAVSPNMIQYYLWCRWNFETNTHADIIILKYTCSKHVPNWHWHHAFHKSNKTPHGSWFPSAPSTPHQVFCNFEFLWCTTL